MAENKTTWTGANVDEFLAAVPEPQRSDARSVCALMRELSGHEPAMWGPSIVGFGRYHYRYDSGREGEAPRIGFSPRKGNLVLYVLVPGFDGHEPLLSRLGKHKTGKACLYLKRLSDTDPGVLRELIVQALGEMDARYPR